MPWPNLTQEEIDWRNEHGCIHGLYPEESVMFCPNCQPDASEVYRLLDKRREAIAKEKAEKDEQL
jgi:hypothetical protein